MTKYLHLLTFAWLLSACADVADFEPVALCTEVSEACYIDFDMCNKDMYGVCKEQAGDLYSCLIDTGCDGNACMWETVELTRCRGY